LLFVFDLHANGGLIGTNEKEFMNLKSLLALIAILEICCWQAGAQIYDTNGAYVQTFVGSAFSGYVDGVGQNTMFNHPSSVTADSLGNLYVWDSGNYRFRKVTPDGTVTTFVGGGSYDTGYGTNVNLAPLSQGGCHFFTKNDVIYYGSKTSSSSTAIFMLFTNGYVTNFTVSTSYNPDWPSEYVGVVLDSKGKIYFNSSSENRIYEISTNGAISVFAGSGNGGNIDGVGIFSSFNRPTCLAIDQADNIYVWDYSGGVLRRIDPNQNVTTIAGMGNSSIDGTGTNVAFGLPDTMICDNQGNLYFSSLTAIRRMDSQTNVTTVAGDFGDLGYTNGIGRLARFSGADGFCIYGNTIYVADSNNNRIRSITNNPTPQNVSAANLGIGTFAGVTITGTVGRTYQIQSSSDFNAWTTHATILLNASPYLWIDLNPVAGNKFYRAYLLP
jgi:streptogramin lyase